MDRLTRASLGPGPGWPGPDQRAAGPPGRPPGRDGSAPPRVSGPELPAKAASITRMNAITLLAGLAIGVILGAAIGFLLARGRQAASVAGLTGRASAAEQRARAAEDKAAMVEHSARERAALVEGQLAER